MQIVRDCARALRAESARPGNGLRRSQKTLKANENATQQRRRPGGLALLGLVSLRLRPTSYTIMLAMAAAELSGPPPLADGHVLLLAEAVKR